MTLRKIKIEGTISNSFQVGLANGGGAGIRTLSFNNGSVLQLQANPSSNKIITIPDSTGTLEIQSNKNIANGYPGLNGSLKIDGSQQTYGTSVNTACQGNDSRLTDDRTASGLRTNSTIVSISSANAPSAGQVLTAANSTTAIWQTPSGGGGSPGGVSGEVQFNNSGSFGGASGLKIQTENLPLIGELTGSINPTLPSTGVVLFARNKTNRRMICQQGPSGVDYILQPNIFANKIGLWSAAGNSTTISAVGLAAPSATGTATSRTVATTNFSTQLRRLGYVSATTAGASAGVRTNALQFWRGNAANLGGFFLQFRFVISQVQSNMRWFVGIYGSASVIGNVNPSTLTNIIGFGIDSGHTTVRLMHNDGTSTATSTDLGVNFPATTANVVYDARIFCPPNGTVIGYSLDRLDVAQTINGTINTDIPANTQLLAPQLWINNGTTAAAVAVDIINMYVETDN